MSSSIIKRIQSFNLIFFYLMWAEYQGKKIDWSMLGERKGWINIVARKNWSTLDEDRMSIESLRWLIELTSIVMIILLVV